MPSLWLGLKLLEIDATNDSGNIYVDDSASAIFDESLSIRPLQYSLLVFSPGISGKTYRQSVEVGFVIVTEDSDGGMVDIHDRRPVVLEPDDAWRWMEPDTSVEEAAHIAQGRSLPTEEFTWWRVSREGNRADPGNNEKHLLAPVNGGKTDGLRS